MFKSPSPHSVTFVGFLKQGAIVVKSFLNKYELLLSILTLWHNVIHLSGYMIVVKELVWDDWNREHLIKHNVTPEEVKEVFVSNYQTVESYRKRLLVVGKTKAGRKLAIVLAPEDRELRIYGEGIYYVITAFEKEV